MAVNENVWSPFVQATVTSHDLDHQKWFLIQRDTPASAARRRTTKPVHSEPGHFLLGWRGLNVTGRSLGRRMPEATDAVVSLTLFRVPSVDGTAQALSATPTFATFPARGCPSLLVKIDALCLPLFLTTSNGLWTEVADFDQALFAPCRGVTPYLRFPKSQKFYSGFQS